MKDISFIFIKTKQQHFLNMACSIECETFVDLIPHLWRLLNKGIHSFDTAYDSSSQITKTIKTSLKNTNDAKYKIK